MKFTPFEQHLIDTFKAALASLVVYLAIAALHWLANQIPGWIQMLTATGGGMIAIKITRPFA